MLKAVALMMAIAATGMLARSEADHIQMLKRAAALIEQNDLGAAETELKPLVGDTSDDAVALNLLGLIRVRQGNSSEAERLFVRAISTGHKIIGPRINLAMMYAASRPEEALDELKNALIIAPDDSQAQTLVRTITKESALSAIRSGKTEKAVALVVKAREIRPKDPEVLYEYGMVTFESGLYPDAQAALERALQLRPGYSEAQYALARVYLSENLAQQAEDEMSDYLATKPDDATALYGLGYILVAEQKLEQAREAFNRSLELQPQQTESLFQLGEIALEQGHTDSAREIFMKVLSRNPRHGGALTELGVIAFRATRYEEARNQLRQAVEAAPFYQKAHYYYALALVKSGEKEQAGREFELSKQLQKKHASNVSLGSPLQ